MEVNNLIIIEFSQNCGLGQLLLYVSEAEVVALSISHVNIQPCLVLYLSFPSPVLNRSDHHNMAAEKKDKSQVHKVALKGT